MKKLNFKKTIKRGVAVTLSLAIIFISTVLTSKLNAPKAKENEYPVHITYHNLKHVRFMSSGTVSDALKEADIKLQKDDVMNVSQNSAVYDGIDIVVNEVKYISNSDTEKIASKTEYQHSDDYPQGYEEVKTQGKHGAVEITTTYKYVNGEFHSVCGKTQQVLEKPQNKVVLKGTAEIAQASNLGTASHSATTTTGSIDGLSYSRVLTGSATAYTASQGALTATGVPAYVGGVAVNPNIIPYGSKLYIVADGYTYGYATAVDTGGALMSGTALVDLYMSTYDECINFGRRNVTVYVLS